MSGLTRPSGVGPRLLKYRTLWLLAFEAAPTASIPAWGLSAGLNTLWPVVVWASEPTQRMNTAGLV